MSSDFNDLLNLQKKLLTATKKDIVPLEKRILKCIVSIKDQEGYLDLMKKQKNARSVHYLDPELSQNYLAYFKIENDSQIQLQTMKKLRV